VIRVGVIRLHHAEFTKGQRFVLTYTGNYMTQIEAFEKALWLAITANSREKIDKALALASEIGFTLTDEQVGQAMAMVEKRLEVPNEH
jgi:hypothetical protein